MVRQFTAIVLAATVALIGTQADALYLGGSAQQFKTVNRSFIIERGPTLAPMGHVVFCMKLPSECRTLVRRTGRIAATDARMRQLNDVNRAVNRAIVPQMDPRGKPIADVWSLEPRAGDCEDFAVTKRHRLIALGWPASQLRIAVGRTAAGEGHAVLVVRTRSGDLVLDNRTDAILPWTRSDIRWVSIQAGGNPRYWHLI